MALLLKSALGIATLFTAAGTHTPLNTSATLPPSSGTPHQYTAQDYHRAMLTNPPPISFHQVFPQR